MGKKGAAAARSVDIRHTVCKLPGCNAAVRTEAKHLDVYGGVYHSAKCYEIAKLVTSTRFTEMGREVERRCDNPSCGKKYKVPKKMIGSAGCGWRYCPGDCNGYVLRKFYRLQGQPITMRELEKLAKLSKVPIERVRYCLRGVPVGEEVPAGIMKKRERA